MARKVSFKLGEFTVTWEGEDPYADGLLSTSTALVPFGELPALTTTDASASFGFFAERPYYQAHGGAPVLGTRTLVGLLMWLRRYAEMTGYKPEVSGDTSLVDDIDRLAPQPTQEERDRIY